tara:strand:- start:59 stop:895 length:837 start_codon:yes stop_codon:yes gene_type:complete
MANLSYGDIAKQSSYTRMSKLLIGKSIRDAIKVAPMSDADLGQKIGVSENTIRRWKLGTVTNIRKSNLSNLAKALNKQISFSNETVELHDFIETDNIITIEDTGDTMQLKSEDIINDLRDDKKDLRERIAFLKEENTALHITVESMDKNLEQLNKRVKQNQVTMPILELDKCQNVVNVKEGIYMNVSPLFAEKLGYTVFELVGRSYYDVLAEEDRQKWMELSVKINKTAFTETPKECKQEITEYDVRFQTKEGKIINARSKTKTLSNIITMNEITFLN